jgi:hypothetical protein
MFENGGQISSFGPDLTFLKPYMVGFERCKEDFPGYDKG